MQTTIAAAALILALTGCGVRLPGPDPAIAIDDLDTEPKPGQVDAAVPPAGPVIEVLRGHVGSGTFVLTAYRSGSGPCLSSSSPAGSGVGCGAMPGEGVGVEDSPFGMMGIGSGDRNQIQEINGLVSLETETVWIETESGDRYEAVVASLEPADIAANAFIAFLPADVLPTNAVAVDASGEVLGAHPFMGFRPFDPDLPPPTPAS